MNKIASYEDLLTERKRLENNILDRKRNIAKGIEEIKEKFEPFLYLLPILSAFKNKGTILKTVGTLALDAFVTKKLFANSPWLSRILSPVLKRFL